MDELVLAGTTLLFDVDLDPSSENFWQRLFECLAKVCQQYKFQKEE